MGEENTGINLKMLLEVRHLRIEFDLGDRLSVPVRDVSFAIPENGRVALVGESGSGKSLTALAIGGLVDRARITGKIVGQPKMAYVFQNPMQSLNPVMRIGKQIGETGAKDIAGLLTAVGLPENSAKKFPCELSGGQQQRVMIAMALGSEPELLIADEPTTALDVTTQREVLDLIEQVANARGMAVLLITHNLGLVKHYSREVNVMYAGEIVERGRVIEVMNSPGHPYTQGLLKAIPRLDASKDAPLVDISGTVPPPWDWPSGCAFHPRCPYADDSCRQRVKHKCISSTQNTRI